MKFLFRNRIALCVICIIGAWPFAMDWILSCLGMSRLGVVLEFLGLAINALILGVALLVAIFLRGSARVVLWSMAFGAFLSFLPGIFENHSKLKDGATIPVFMDLYYEGTQSGQRLICYKDGSWTYSCSGVFDFLLHDSMLGCSGTYGVSNGVIYLSCAKGGIIADPPIELRLVTSTSGIYMMEGVRTNRSNWTPFNIYQPTNQYWETMGLQMQSPQFSPTSAYEIKEWLESAGRTDSQYNLGVCYAYGDGVEKNPAVALLWFQKAAEEGDDSALYELGELLSRGDGLSQNLPEAMKCYRKAAGKGNSLAQAKLGYAYSFGAGVEKNDIEAASWFRKAADQGAAKAQYNLACCYATGKGLDKNPAEAAEWFLQAANQGLMQAQRRIGMAYECGNGVEINPAEAVKWYRKSAAQGDDIAQCNLGILYVTGNGVETNHAVAVSLFRRSAEQGNAESQYQLGTCYAKGQGVNRDYPVAYGWFLLATAGGITQASPYITLLEMTLSPAELQTARTWVNQWKQVKSIRYEKAHSCLIEN